uniref:Uncharacterized protein n=1 Tax=Takifugu rubripes TaxID=31033 RepID=A0A3B5KCB6_TAKRU
MSVQFCLALLALCSLAAASDPDCKELLKPQENRTQVLGKWILHATVSESNEVGEKVKVIKSSWIEISDVPGQEALSLRWADRLSGEKCEYGSVNHTFSPNITHVKYDYNSTSYEAAGMYLDTCPDCVVWEDTLTENQKGRTLYILTKTGSLEAPHMERFKKQAACLNLKSEMYFPETTDLCPDEEGKQ